VKHGRDGGRGTGTIYLGDTQGKKNDEKSAIHASRGARGGYVRGYARYLIGTVRCTEETESRGADVFYRIGERARFKSVSSGSVLRFAESIDGARRYLVTAALYHAMASAATDPKMVINGF
jgi:hypothetical protein